MMCFRDTSFCSSPGCVNACGRQLTHDDREAAKRWAQTIWGHDDAPISRMPYCDDAGALLVERRSAPRETGAQDDN